MDTIKRLTARYIREAATAMTPDSVVRAVVKVQSDFEVIDEWHSTSIYITLALRTKKKIPPELAVTWVKAHWNEVLKKAPSKTPRQESRNSRGMSYDEPYPHGHNNQPMNPSLRLQEERSHENAPR